MQALESTVQAYLAGHPDVEPGARVLVAVSGGPDSVALADVLDRLGFEVGVAHVHYGLRPEAEAERDHVRAWSEERGWLCHVLEADSEARMAGESVQAWARRVRYGFFEAIRERADWPWLATGHHRQDRIETLLISLLRGGRPGQLRDLPARRGTILRPLIHASSDSIHHYLCTHALRFFEDASNHKPLYLRNQIRLELEPLLSQLNPSFGDRLLELAAEIQDRAALVGDWVQQVAVQWDGVRQEGGDWFIDSDRFPSDSFQQFFPASHPRNGRVFLQEFLAGKSFYGNEIQRIIQLVGAHPGAEYFCSRDGGDWEVLRIQGGLRIRWTPRERKDNSFISIPISLSDLVPDQWVEHTMGPWRIRLQWTPKPADIRRATVEGVHFLSWNALKGPLTFRSWREGDRMQPLGMQGTRLLSDIFSELGVPKPDRMAWPVLEDSGGTVLLVAGYRVAEGVKVGEEPMVLRVEMQRL